jgi:antitoxin MazE
MHTQIARWGNSLAVRIPKAYADSLGLVEGASVDIDATATALIIRREGPTLEELLDGITPENCHGEFDFGPSVGNEAW